MKALFKICREEFKSWSSY